MPLHIGSTDDRFAQYHTGAPPYVRKGPAKWPMRLLGPLVVLTRGRGRHGRAAGIAGPGNGPWRFLHMASFVLWCRVHGPASWRLRLAAAALMLAASAAPAGSG